MTVFNFDLTEAWSECQTYYNMLKTTYITFYGATISLWALICSAYVVVSLLDVFLYFKNQITADEFFDD